MRAIAHSDSCDNLLAGLRLKVYYKFLDEETPAVMPDKRIDRDWLDYKAGRDPVVEWILSRNDGSKVSIK